MQILWNATDEYYLSIMVVLIEAEKVCWKTNHNERKQSNVYNSGSVYGDKSNMIINWSDKNQSCMHFHTVPNSPPPPKKKKKKKTEEKNGLSVSIAFEIVN